VAIPLVLGRFHVYLFTGAMIWAIFALSFYLLFGHTGLLSMGHAAYFGLGSYVTALCLVHFPNVSLPLALLAGTLSGLLGGIVIGSMLVRLTKIYYSFATLAFAQMLWAMAWKWRSLTGGDDGLIGWSTRKVVVPFLGQFTLSNTIFLYYVVFLVAIVAGLMCWYFIKTPLGNTLASIKSNATRVDFLGVDVHRAKLMLFGFSGAIAGLSGSLYILFKRVVAPSFLDMGTSFDIVVISVIGGYSHFIGSIVGSFTYVYFSEYFSSFTDRWQFIMGIFFILVVLFSPQGLVGVFQKAIGQICFWTRKARS
jgi:branched-chain amino acid transport system permease protein